MITPELIAFLRRGVEKAARGSHGEKGTLKGAQKKFAEAIGVDPGRISNLIRGRGEYTLNEGNCFRLAVYLDEPSPLDILRAAEKHDLALLVERYLAPTIPLPSEQQLLEDWRELEPTDRPCWAFLIRSKARSLRSVQPPT